MREAAIDAVYGGKEAQTVRADDAHQVHTSSIQHGLFLIGRETRRYHDSGPASGCSQLRYKTRNGTRGRGNHGKIRSFGKCRSRWIAGLPQDFGRAWVDQHDASGEPTAEEIARDDLTNRTRLHAGADKRDCTWREEGVEIACGHRLPGSSTQGFTLKGLFWRRTHNLAASSPRS